MRIVVLHNTVRPGAGEADLDTLVQVEAVHRGLGRLGHAVERLEAGPDLAGVAARLRDMAPDLAFNLVETEVGGGERADAAPALLESMGLAFTGAGASAMRLSSHKLLAKVAMAEANIPTPDWASLQTSGQEARFVPGEYIVKSVCEHASLGLDAGSVVWAGSREALCAAMREPSATPGGEWFAERYIEGREFNLALLDRPGEGSDPHAPEILPLAEIVFQDFAAGQKKIVGYRAKWDEASEEYRKTVRSFAFAPEEARLVARVRDIGLACWRAFGLGGYARIDFRMDGSGAPLVIDINANPCLTPDAGFAAALGQAGMSYDRALERICAAGLSRAGAKERRA